MTCRKQYGAMLLLALAATMAAHAQRHGGGGMHGGGPMGGMRGEVHPDGGGSPGMRGGADTPGGRTGMAGRWWDDKSTARSLGLDKDQQKRMDRVFSQNRDALQQHYDAFVKAKTKLDAMKKSGDAPESALFAGIQHTAQARAELEQAYTHMQLQIRGELTPGQLSRMEEQH